MKSTAFFLGVLDEIPFQSRHQETNYCVDYSTMLSVMLTACHRNPELVEGMKADKEFPMKVRTLLGKRAYSRIYPSQLAKVLKDCPIQLDLGSCKVVLSGLIPRKVDKDVLRNDLRGYRVPIVSITYKKKRSDGIFRLGTNPFQLTSKHNAVIIKAEDDGLWCDTSTDIAYSLYPDGVKFLTGDILYRKGTLARQGLAFSYIPQFRILKK